LAQNNPKILHIPPVVGKTTENALTPQFAENITSSFIVGTDAPTVADVICWEA
jgi:hypothetical protein